MRRLLTHLLQLALCAVLCARSPDAAASGDVHVVKSGQTLGGIAHEHAVSVSALCRYNGIQKDRPLRVGQKLKIPPSKPGQARYTVRKGDTLGGIARRFGTTVSALAEMNRLKRDAPIRVGQEVTVPANRRDTQRAGAPDEPESAASPPPAGLERLPVPGVGMAYYYEPTGRGRLALRPVLMYLHGRGGDPAADCRRWGRVARRMGWVVCPAGPEDRGAGKRGWNNDWPRGRTVVMATLEALRAKFGRRVQLYGNTLIGFSEGAYVAMNVGVREPRAFNRWLILGADTDYWGAAGLESLDKRKERVRRVYLITGKGDQVYQDARRVTGWLRRAGVAVRVSTPSDLGHELALESKPAMYRAALSWLDRGAS